ncbi:MAG: hypothetical protein ACLGG1_00890 [Gammaproteobacteria bacterium]
MHTLPYRREGNDLLIEVRLNTVRQLFNTLDPSPFHEKDLDSAAEHYLVSAVEELPADAVFKVVVHLPAAELATAQARLLPEAIHNYFAWQTSEAHRRLRGHLREARDALVLGTLFLALCVTMSAFVGTHLTGLLAEFLSEGTLIIGWVALWRPVDLFLYAWRPLRRQWRNLERIAGASVELRSDDRLSVAGAAR